MSRANVYAKKNDLSKKDQGKCTQKDKDATINPENVNAALAKQQEQQPNCSDNPSAYDREMQRLESRLTQPANASDIDKSKTDTGQKPAQKESNKGLVGEASKVKTSANNQQYTNEQLNTKDSKTIQKHLRCNDKSQKSLQIGTLNVCGLKRRSLYPDFNDLVSKFDVFFTVETKLDKHDIISLQGYTFISNPRKQIVLRKSRGIGIYLKNDISEHISQIETQLDYSAWIKISKLYTKLKDDIIIGACYVPPQNSKYYNKDDFAQLEQEIMSFCCESKYVFITEDLYAKIASMQDFTRSDASFDKYLDLDQETIDFF